MTCMGEEGEQHAVQMTDDEGATPMTNSGVSRAVSKALERIDAWRLFVKADDVVLAFTQGYNFRKKLSRFYKATRTIKPAIYEDVEAEVRASHTSVSYEGTEGDDALGLTQNWLDSDTVVVSGDKDIRTIPGYIYHVPHWARIKKGDFGKVEYNTTEEADRFWMMQTLMGDTTDGYGGCPGVGPKRAKEVLEVCHTTNQMWGAVVAEYTAKHTHKSWGKKFVHGGGPRQEALINARLARILRAGDYDHDKQEVKLWAP
jgi:DNA polymerase-1